MYGFTALAPPESMLRAITTRPRSLYFSQSRSMAGISSLQGGHQVAHRFRNTTLPLRSLRRSPLPSSEGTLKSFAGCCRLGLMRASSFAGSVAAADAGRAAQQSAIVASRRRDRHMANRVYMAVGPRARALAPL